MNPEPRTNPNAMRTGSEHTGPGGPPRPDPARVTGSFLHQVIAGRVLEERTRATSDRREGTGDRNTPTADRHLLADLGGGREHEKPRQEEGRGQVLHPPQCPLRYLTTASVRLCVSPRASTATR
jgi:hypothetical protein